MQILGFYGTPDQARAVRSEMLESGFDPLAVGLYGGVEIPAEERSTWFAFAPVDDRRIYREATRRGATAVLVDLAGQSSELADGGIAIEILERHGPLDLAGWAGDRACSGNESASAPASGPIADWHPADLPIEGLPMRHGIRCHGQERVASDSPDASAIVRFIREFAAGAGHVGRDWNLVESQLQRQFSSRYPGTDWENARDRVQREYDRVRGASPPA